MSCFLLTSVLVLYNLIFMSRHNCLVGDHIWLWCYVLNVLNCLDILYQDLRIIWNALYFLSGFRSNFQIELYQIFGRFSGVRKFTNHIPRLGFLDSWLGSQKLDPIQGHAAVATCRPSGQGVIILLVSKLSIFLIPFSFLRV